MGIYDREYYRGETRGSLWLTGVAPATKALILINCAVFILAHLNPNNTRLFSSWFAATSDGIFRYGRVWELLTATFLHQSLLHLIGNMLFLWFAGRELESMYGSRDFVALYISAAIVSTLGWAICDGLTAGDRRVTNQMIGASGAVLALVVIYAMYFPRREVLFMFVLPVEVWVLVAAFLAYQVFLLLGGGDWQTAVESHLVGAAYGYLFKRFDLRWSRLPLNRPRRPRLRIVNPDPREVAAPRSGGIVSGPTWSSETVAASVSKPSSTAVVTEEQLDARLDEVLAKIAREGRGSLTEEENRVLQEASRRARNRRSERL
ncbi:MAG: rhomboid family intramembrane serine protease [Isosphaeraceae bacterium]